MFRPNCANTFYGVLAESQLNYTVNESLIGRASNQAICPINVPMDRVEAFRKIEANNGNAVYGNVYWRRSISGSQAMRFLLV
jgi:hypothetical protein